MTTRRSILGMLAGAPVAASTLGPDAAMQQAVGIGRNVASRGLVAGGLASVSTADWIKSRVADIRKELGEVEKDRDTRLAEIRRSISQVDPDIAAMRSISDVTKQRMQAERNYESEIRNRRSWLGRQLEDLLNQPTNPT